MRDAAHLVPDFPPTDAAGRSTPPAPSPPRAPSPLRYRELMRLSIAHEYFDDGPARGLTLEPEPDCAAWLRRHALIVRQDQGALLLAAAESQLPALWQDLRAAAARGQVLLAWRLRSRDPDFDRYTERRAPRRVQPDPGSAADLPDWLAALPLRPTLRLRARLSTWKYLLVGDWPSGPLTLSERAGRAEFRRDEPERLDDGRLAQVFRSTRRLPLRERGSLRLELQDLGGTAPRRLLNPVPLAAPAGLICEQRAGRRRPVHEIFLNR
ncbi:hypothetical protein CDN99_24150 [Roseateles aquatilis]|uniref:Uncharacterized protein n=1 Tax=Roseateles aquatilis TaxID=431061 RepID=A0A246IVZ3_9BURK|nr:hypothetical protein [Roseateles aquatilis]OWQ84391.1 hypothetical protein CDN99_24150 [Roseateles aquatilis]